VTVAVLTVYLVEDDPLVSRHVREALDRAPGIRCVGHADRIATARAQLPHYKPDVLLSDLGLPDGDGTDLIGEISGSGRGDDGGWHPHILVFSVFGDETRVIQAIEVGADGYFQKGCTADELVRSVEQVGRGESPISPAIARNLLQRLDEGDFVDSSFRDSGFRDSGYGSAIDPGLSNQEMQVLQLVAQGYVSDEIASRLSITAGTVATTVRSVYRKLQQSQRQRSFPTSTRRQRYV
jgi:DNA-binding NarL/FixJ family response regulator